MDAKSGGREAIATRPITLAKLPIAVDLEDLRRIEALLREHGPCRMRRFDATYESLDGLLADHPLPLKHINFETPELCVALDAHGATITGLSGPALDAVAAELDRLKVSPMVRFANPIRLGLAVAFATAIFQDALAWAMVPFVALVLFERGVESELTRKGALATQQDRQRDVRMSWAIFALVMVLARVVVSLMDGLMR